MTAQRNKGPNTQRTLMLTLPHKIHSELIALTQKGYPEEVCGLLVGKRGPTKKEIQRLYPVSNLNPDHKNDRYDLDPKQYAAIEKAAENEGLKVIGIYHSHPDHPSMASETDRSLAWPIFSYVICSINQGKFSQMQSWILNEESKQFIEEEIQILS